MSYTLFTLPAPIERISHGVSGVERRMETPKPVYPATFVQRLHTEGRVELWEDSAGKASMSEVDAACPGLRDARAREIRLEGAKRLRGLADPYMDEERETWQDQKQEAIAWSADSSVSTPMIDQMVEKRGIAKEHLVARIVANVTMLRPLSGAILGIQQRLLDCIYATDSINDLLSVSWPEGG